MCLTDVASDYWKYLKDGKSSRITNQFFEKCIKGMSALNNHSQPMGRASFDRKPQLLHYSIAAINVFVR